MYTRVHHIHTRAMHIILSSGRVYGACEHHCISPPNPPYTVFLLVCISNYSSTVCIDRAVFRACTDTAIPSKHKNHSLGRILVHADIPLGPVSSYRCCSLYDATQTWKSNHRFLMRFLLHFNLFQHVCKRRGQFFRHFFPHVAPQFRFVPCFD